MKHQKGEKPKLIKIARLFSEIEDVWNELSNETKSEIYDFHSEDTNLNHLIRWGTQNAAEIVDNTKLDKE